MIPWWAYLIGVATGGVLIFSGVIIGGALVLGGKKAERESEIDIP